jgi:hypothetical protein
MTASDEGARRVTRMVGAAAQACARAAYSVATRVFPLAQHTPAARWATTTSRFPGSRLGVPPSPSRIVNPVVFDVGTPLTVAGAARAFYPSSLKSPYRGTCCVRVRCRKTPCWSTGECFQMDTALPIDQNTRQAPSFPGGEGKRGDLGDLLGGKAACSAASMHCRITAKG